ncbi:hypothetical protein C8R44DRAFT_726746 [Mycena epipterygia]|nr:hypothetical protein C8R44DRAFT_726746 [Mycena epipterygia]
MAAPQIKSSDSRASVDEAATGGNWISQTAYCNCYVFPGLQKQFSSDHYVFQERREGWSPRIGCILRNYRLTVLHGGAIIPATKSAALPSLLTAIMQLLERCGLLIFPSTPSLPFYRKQRPSGSTEIMPKSVQREMLAKMVASLNTVRRKGKSTINIVDQEEEEELAE